MTGLSAITCDFTRKPFLSLGSIVTRKSGASLQSEVIWHTTTEPCAAGRASVWTITAGRGLVVLLAGELYERDHGTPASSDQMLVGPYLHELPADGSAELDDGSAPMIREGDATASAKEG